jgi:hypothetical protein
MRNALIILFLLVSISYFSCESKNEEDLFGKEECDTLNVTFSADFLPILESICYDCHSQAKLSAPYLLEGYDNLKIMVDNGRLQMALHHTGQYRMPKFRDKLPDCTLAKIDAWIDDGAPNN